MATRAFLQNANFSAQKGRLVADEIRGKKVEDALNFLTYCNKKAAGVIRKVVNSAISNAEHNDSADIDALYIKTIYVDEGKSMFRWRARAKGRGSRIVKRRCHITVEVEEAEE